MRLRLALWRCDFRWWRFRAVSNLHICPNIISFSHAVWPMWWKNPNLTYLWFDMPAIRKEYCTLGKTCKPKTWASQGFKAAFCRSHLVAANSSASCDAQSKDAQPSEATPKLVSVGLSPAAWATSEGAGKTCSWFHSFVFRFVSGTCRPFQDHHWGCSPPFQAIIASSGGQGFSGGL